MTPLPKGFVKDTWIVATTFMGTVVGAGFASGQEILKFFSHFGIGGIAGIMLSCLLFCITGTIIMLLGAKLRAASFGEVVRFVCGSKAGPVIDILLAMFLFGTLSVMLAGSGAVFFQLWGLPYWVGTLSTVIISILTVLFGIKGIIKANFLVVPLMVFLCLVTTLPSVLTGNLAANLGSFTAADRGAAPHWLLSALLYVSYNITLGLSVLAPLGREIKNAPSLVWGGIFGGLGLGTLAMLINLAILSHYPDSAQYEVPSLFVAGRLGPIIQLLFSFILWAEIFTTVIGTVYGLAVRISGQTGLRYSLAVIFLMLMALGLSQLGFSDLVGTIYPLFGYISLIFLVCLLVVPACKRR